MSTCSHCGAEYGEAKFCPKCGRALQITCPGCGQPVQPGNTFCGNCGARLAEAAVSPEASAPVPPPRPQMVRPQPTPNGASTPSTPPPRPAAPRPAPPAHGSQQAVPLAYAPLNNRMKAWVIDSGLLAIAVLILFFPLIATSGDAGGAFMGFVLWWTILSLIYFAAVEMAGTTIGKAIVGLQIVDENGKTPGPVRSLIRNALRIADFLPLFYLLGYLTANSSPTRQRLGDRIAHTYVISRRG